MVVTTSTSSSITEISDACFYAEAEVGDNGAVDGVPEFDVGTDSDNESYGYITWDEDLSDGFDSGIVVTTLIANAGGGTNNVVWSIEGGAPEPLNFTGVTYGLMKSVKIRAAVQEPNMQMRWTDVTISFYKAGTLIESVTLSSAQLPQASTMGQSGPAAAEFITTITPANTDNDMVTVAGCIEMIAPDAREDNPPGPEDIFGQIFVYTSTCSPSPSDAGETSTTLTANGSTTSYTTQALSFTVAVTGGVPDGETVTLEDTSNNSAVVATGVLSSGQASLTVTAGTLQVGTHNLVAVYGGDANLNGSQSNMIVQTVEGLVTNLNDSGTGSLRQAILDAESNGGVQIIACTSGLSGTITLTSGNLVLTGVSDQVTIEGPGSGAIAISGVISNSASLYLDGNISVGTLAGGGNLYIGDSSNSGSVAINILNQNALTINSGSTLQLARSGTPMASMVNSLTINNGTLDLVNNGLVINYGTNGTVLPDITSLILSGKNGGSWNGTGIASTVAATNSSTVGIGDGEASAIGLSSGSVFMGQTLSSTNAVVLRTTLLGDANLNGEVNGADYNILRINFGMNTQLWTNGNFNYTGDVNGGDFNDVRVNFGQNDDSL